MKTVFKSKIIAIALLTGVLFSCKDNKDGYSDEIVTKTPTDSTQTSSAHGEDIGTQSAEATHEADPGNPGTGNASPGEASPGTTGSASTASGGSQGTGSGPGESAKDGATYTTASGAQKDSTKTTTKSSSKTKSAK